MHDLTPQSYTEKKPPLPVGWWEVPRKRGSTVWAPRLVCRVVALSGGRYLEVNGAPLSWEALRRNYQVSRARRIADPRPRLEKRRLRTDFTDRFTRH
jgi:hypothetical protein